MPKGRGILQKPCWQRISGKTLYDAQSIYRHIISTDKVAGKG
jgi:hypothetical protein